MTGRVFDGTMQFDDLADAYMAACIGDIEPDSIRANTETMVEMLKQLLSADPRNVQRLLGKCSRLDHAALRETIGLRWYDAGFVIDEAIPRGEVHFCNSFHPKIRTKLTELRF